MHDIENSNEGFITPIERVILHEGFESDYLHDTNDIALIKLKYPVQYNENVRPVCLPYKGTSNALSLFPQTKTDTRVYLRWSLLSHLGSDHTGHRVKVTGWGRVTTNGGASRFLRQADLKVMSWVSCRNTSFGDHLTESMLCAYTDDTDACQVKKETHSTPSRPQSQSFF